MLVAYGSKTTIAHVDEHLATVPAAALCGGTALYLLGHVALRLRTIRTLNRQRAITAVLALALIPIATTVPALAALALTSTLMVILIAFEAFSFSGTRTQIRARAPRPT